MLAVKMVVFDYHPESEAYGKFVQFLAPFLGDTPEEMRREAERHNVDLIECSLTEAPDDTDWRKPNFTILDETNWPGLFVHETN